MDEFLRHGMNRAVAALQGHRSNRLEQLSFPAVSFRGSRLGKRLGGLRAGALGHAFERSSSSARRWLVVNNDFATGHNCHPLSR
jgi:hypothetical protein